MATGLWLLAAGVNRLDAVMTFCFLTLATGRRIQRNQAAKGRRLRPHTGRIVGSTMASSSPDGRLALPK
jgi:hypothetical protein